MYGAPVGTIQLTSGGGYLISSTNTTTNVVTNPATRVFHLSLVSGTTGSTIQILNGANGNVVINESGTASKGAEFDYGFHGKTFPLGAYVVTDANFIGGSIDIRADIV